MEEGMTVYSLDFDKDDYYVVFMWLSTASEEQVQDNYESFIVDGKKVTKYNMVFEVQAQCMNSAIVQATKVMQAERAIEMLNFIQHHPHYTEPYSNADIEAAIEEGIEGYVFAQWMMKEPNAVQVTQQKDASILNDFSVSQAIKAVDKTGDKAEQYLKEQ